MKSLPLTFAVFLLAGCLLITTSSWSNTPFRKYSEENYPFMIGKKANATPVFFHSFSDFIPFYSFDHSVCRKPLISNNLLPDFTRYKFKGFSFNTQPVGTHFIYVNGGFTYEKGNTLLLIPHSFFMPLTPNLDTKSPSITLPGSN